MKEIRIGNTAVGDGHPCYIVAEIGINHNGDIDIAKKLIDVAAIAGCNAVKFQKRTIDVVYSAEELARPRESPYGTTNGELKYGLEFEKEEFEVVQAFDGKEGIIKAVKEQPDFILLDLIMPIMEGTTTLRHLKDMSETKNIPVAILTVVPNGVPQSLNGEEIFNQAVGFWEKDKNIFKRRSKS